MKLASVCLGAVLALAVTTQSAQAAQSASCDRACLVGLLDGYVAAMVAKDPKRVPVAAKVRFTENTNEMKLGDGLWGTITGVGTYKLYVADPTAHQAMYYGVVKENGRTALFGVRIKEQGRKLTEIETYVIRKESGVHGTFDALTNSDPVWDEVLPPAQRRPRAEMIKATNLYFEAIEQGNGDLMAIEEDALRIENGRLTAPTPASDTRPAYTVRTQMNTKTFNYIPHVTQRRFLAVDEERGLVFGTFMFQHPGNIPRPGNASGVPAATGTTVDLASFPNTTEIIEVFKLRNGKLYRIFAYVSLLPYRQAPGWP